MCNRKANDEVMKKDAVSSTRRLFRRHFVTRGTRRIDEIAAIPPTSWFDGIGDWGPGDFIYDPGRMRPLDDLFVVDLSRILSGPICTMMMADMGAECRQSRTAAAGRRQPAMGPSICWRHQHVFPFHQSEQEKPWPEPEDRSRPSDTVAVNRTRRRRHRKLSARRAGTPGFWL